MGQSCNIIKEGLPHCPHAPAIRISSLELLSMPGFRLSARKFLVTYPRCYESPHSLLVFLHAKRPIKKAIGCIELHEANEELIDEILAPTGEVPHVHLAIEFETKLNTINPRWFDFEEYHPNVQAATTWGACVNYCRKDFVEVEYFNCTAEEAATSEANEPLDLFAHARQLDGDREGWTNFCQHRQISFARECYVWNRLHNSRRDNCTIYDEPELDPAFKPDNDDNDWIFNLPAEPLSQCLALCMGGGICKSLFILGPSGVGKTTFLKSIAPKPCLWVRHIDNLQYFDGELHKSIIFDELRFDGDAEGRGKWPLPSQVVAVDTRDPQQIHCRYKPAFVPAKVPKFFSFADTIGFTRDLQIERRVQVINVYTHEIVRGEDISHVWWYNVNRPVRA